MEFIIIFLLGCFIGSKYTLYKIQQALEHELDELLVGMNQMDINDSNSVPQFETEFHSHSLMLYNKSDKTFMCQGNTIEDLAHKTLQQLHIPLAYVTHQECDYWFVDGKVTEATT